MNPFEIPVSRQLHLVIPLLAFLVLLPTPVRADWGAELTPFAGFRFGGSFEDNTTGLDLDVDEGESFGLILDVRATHETEYELFYSVQKTTLQGEGLFAGEPLFDLDIHYLHIGGTYLFPGERVRPFIGAGLGLTYFSPDGPGLDSEINFSLSLGGGVKIPISKRVGLRFEGRGFLTILPDNTDIFCVSSGGAACAVRVQGDVFGQVLLLGGISFGL
ncbi:MAG: porin family protein [Deltaproteobacteria bacterium]|nr:porin family protein [Deltaproteobacteria bacterium]